MALSFRYSTYNHCSLQEQKMQFFHLLLLSILHSALGYVQELTDATFNNAIRRNKNILVAFISSQCHHCHRMLPEFERASATLTRKGITVAKVDCITRGQNTCWSLPVDMYPTVTFYKNGQRQSDFQNERIAQNFVQYAMSNAGIFRQTSSRGRQDDGRCVHYQRYKDQMCQSNQWIKRNCPSMCAGRGQVVDTQQGGCRDDSRCVSYQGYRDYMCNNFEWIQINCRRMCGLC